SRVLDPLAGAEDPAFNEPHVPTGARIFSSAVAEVRIMKTIVAVSLVLTLPAWSLLAETRQDEKGPGKGAALEQFKQLAGEWVGKGKHGDMEHEARIAYKVTSGGSAVAETIERG